MDYKVKLFSELTTKELLEIVKLRISVFVVEQNCPYPEMDEWDETAVHISLLDENKLIGYTRIVDKGNKLTFGRVIVQKDYRGQNLGEELIKFTISETQKRFPNRAIIISAQAHLISFYEKVGFKVVSEQYFRDDIPHIDMKLDK